MRVIRCLLVMSLFYTASSIQADAPSFDERMLDALHEQGAISDEAYQTLKRDAQTEAAGTAATLPAVAAQGDNPEGWKVSWKNGTRVERNDGLFKFKFGGRIQLDSAYISPNGALNDWAMMPEAAGGLGEDLRGFGAEFRRVRIFTEGHFFEHGVFKAQYDFAGSKLTFKDVWVGLDDLPFVGRVRAGHFKEGFSLNNETSSKYITFMERALPAGAFDLGRNTGIAIDNTAFDERMTWKLGGFAEVGGNGNRARSNASNYNFTTRLTGLPLYEDGGSKLIHLGLGYTHKFINENDPISFGGREVHLSEDLVDTGDIMAKGLDQVGLELASVFGPLSVQGEWFGSWVNQVVGKDLEFMGAYGQVSYFVTGEHRVYKRSEGAFDRVSPRRPFSPESGQWGALELGARYSYVDLSNENIRGGTQNNVTLGANWYLYSNLRLMLNFVHSHRDGIGNQDAVETRVSLDF
jgi:phosphate-selective porin OprO and OprP